MKMNLENVKEACLPNIPIHNNLFHFSHRYYGLAAKNSVVQAIFHVFQRTISAIKFKELFWKKGIEFEKNEIGFYS